MIGEERWMDDRKYTYLGNGMWASGFPEKEKKKEVEFGWVTVEKWKEVKERVNGTVFYAIGSRMEDGMRKCVAMLNPFERWNDLPDEPELQYHLFSVYLENQLKKHGRNRLKHEFNRMYNDMRNGKKIELVCTCREKRWCHGNLIKKALVKRYMSETSYEDGVDIKD